MTLPTLQTVKERVRDVKTETHAFYLAARHPHTPWYAKLFVAGVVAFAFSPIDLFPDFVPVLGYVDDLILIPLGIAIAIKLIPPDVLAECRAVARQVGANIKPVNRTAVVVIVGIWVLLAVQRMLWVFEALSPSYSHHLVIPPRVSP